MKTVRHEGEEIHVGCGGVVIKGICVKCGVEKPKKGLKGLLNNKEPFIQKTSDFDAKAYRKRIRNGEDLK